MTGHPGVIVTLDGEVHPPGTPLLFADDLAAVRGDGVFETLLVRDGRACLVDAHLSRMGHSAKLLDLPEPDLAAWRHAIEVATQQWVATPTVKVRCGWSTAAAGNVVRRQPPSSR